MKNCEKLNNLSDIDDHYDVFLIDLWGVIHNGIAAFDNVMPVLQSLKQKKFWQQEPHEPTRRCKLNQDIIWLRLQFLS